MTADHFDEAARRARHLIGDVQRFGLLSAATVVDRYTDMVDRAISDDRLGSAPSPSDGLDPGWLVDGAARVAEAYLRFLEATAVLVASRAEGGDAAPEMERILLPTARPGSSSETSLWVHNPTPAPLGDIDIEVTGLMSSNGVTIPTEAVLASPQRIERLDASSSREFRLRVDVPRDQRVGSYHGLVLISESPGEPIALQLEVEDPEEDRP
ncbi:MAG TPA: hypothetical protein VJA46_07015 [Acidimicrobiia bacterium]|nr:hypothetical protein [Acidimicrobiia bacterium]